MPILKDMRKKKTIKLPKSGGSVVVWDELLAGDLRDFIGSDMVETSGEIKVSSNFAFKSLMKLIVEWDFTNEVNEVLPITQESIDLLPIADFNVLINHLKDVSDKSVIEEAVKKNIKSSST